jgi:aldose 1-epimerase
MSAEPGELLELRQGALELDLCPHLGGTITSFRHRNRDVMRPAAAALLRDGNMRDAACFPLVPFSGRIADARSRFRGQEYPLEPNFPPEPHAIHGQGWQNPWEVAHAGEHFAELRLEHEAPGTPLHYRATQRFTLADAALEVEIGVVNTGEEPMPAGIGLHPYFIRTAGVALQARLDHVWLADERNIPRERVPMPETWDFSGSPRIAGLELDNIFGGWDGKATLIWPETALRLTIEAEPVSVMSTQAEPSAVPPGPVTRTTETPANGSLNVQARWGSVVVASHSPSPSTSHS